MTIINQKFMNEGAKNPPCEAGWIVPEIQCDSCSAVVDVAVCFTNANNGEWICLNCVRVALIRIQSSAA